MKKIDFKDADCRWETGKPDELRVTPKKTDAGKQLAKELTARFGQVVESTGHSVTRYRIERKLAGVFTLTSARGLPRCTQEE